MKYTDISIILPTFNEEKTIGTVIERLLLLPLQKEIIVVNDGSKDKTAEILDKFKDNDYVRILTHKRNSGKGAAVRTGIKKAHGEFLIIQDGDLEQDPQDIVKMLETAKQENLDAVFGTRILNWGLQFDKRYVANMFFALLTNVFFKSHLTDIMTGYKLCRTSIIRNINLNSNGFDIEPEITAELLKHGVRICEIPISYTPRTIKEGKKIRFRDSFKVVGRLMLEKFTR